MKYKIISYNRFLFYVFILLIIAVALVVFIFRPYSYGDTPEIPTGWGYKFAQQYKGSKATPKPITDEYVISHPYLANTSSSTMHVNAYNSDVHPLGGPLGINPIIQSYAHGTFAGESASVTFDSNGNIVSVFGSFKEFTLVLISPVNFEILAKISLPARKSNKTFNIRKIMKDTSGGAYFFLDNFDRAVLVDANQELNIISQVWDGNEVHFEIEKKYNLMDFLTENNHQEDLITSVLPDWEGRYWFVSRDGIVGVLNTITEKISFIILDGEVIQNSFALDEKGIYIVSDRALYGVTTMPDNDRPLIAWREEYERANHKKKGTITLGSGTTPTLIGDKYIAIADNAEPQINVLVYRRDIFFEGSRLICKTPVFYSGESATENTLIGINNSLIIENNYGYDLFTNMIFGRTGTGGITRIDFSEENGNCELIWYNPIISQTTVPKLSLENGLIYVYAKDPSIGWGIDAYYLSAIDFETGETIFEILTGTGVSYDNNWAPITLGPDNSAYIGVLRGLVKVSDGV